MLNLRDRITMAVAVVVAVWFCWLVTRRVDHDRLRDECVALCESMGDTFTYYSDFGCTCGRGASAGWPDGSYDVHRVCN